MANSTMAAQMSDKGGFIAALDQSGGSTPGALKAYGIAESAYNGDAEMFKLMHEMRVRIMTAPRFHRRQGDRRHSVRTDHGRAGQSHAGARLPLARARRGALPESG